MNYKIFFLGLLFFNHLNVDAQSNTKIEATSNELIFVSDTQQPMWVEKLFLKSNHNINATKNIFDAVLQAKPRQLYMLGDVVSLGYASAKWKNVDKFLASCQIQNIATTAVLGNHEVMGKKKKGEQNFQKRFPLNVSTGYISVTDSVAVVLLNSNFSKLSETDQMKQLDWYKLAMENLDATDSIKAVIVSCHHAPFTNSKIVGCSNKVQDHFVPAYLQSKKAQLFITGHAHAFEHFKIKGKDFLVIGGGGGLHQPLSIVQKEWKDLAIDYKPMFHYLSVKRVDENLLVTSVFLKNDFSGFEKGVSFTSNFSDNNLSQNNNLK